MTIDISQTPALVTGANRGLGRALVDELLVRDCPMIYAAMRDVDQNPVSLIWGPQARDVIRPVQLDVTDAVSIRAIGRDTASIGLLINNAGVAEETWSGNYRVNAQGAYDLTYELLPRLKDFSHRGVIVDVLTIYALANPGGPLGNYASSKALRNSDVQALRKWNRDLLVSTVYAGPIRTRMTDGLEIDKAEPEDVAEAIIDGVVSGQEYIYPDPVSEELGRLYETNPRELERVIR